MSPPKRTQAVREPVQVYLAAGDRALLDRVAKKTGLPRAEVLRRGVRRIAADVLSDEDPMLAFVREVAAEPWPSEVPSDVAERHDAYLTAPPPTGEAPTPARKRRAR